MRIRQRPAARRALRAEGRVVNRSVVGGTCLCGAVQFEIAGRVTPVQYCHATRCRKASGSAFAAELAAKAADLRWIRGEDLVTAYEAPLLREPPPYRHAFCRRCGSPLPVALEGTDFVVLHAGVLDGDPETRALRHIFVGQNPSWHAITDDLPRFEEHAPVEQRLPKKADRPMVLDATASSNKSIPIETPRLRLREYEPADGPAVHRYASDPVVVRYMWWGPNSEADTRRFIEQALRHRAQRPRSDYDLAATLRSTGAVIGGASLNARGRAEHATAEIGYCFAPETWGQGYGSEAVAALLDFGFDVARFHRIFALVDPEHTASIRLVERLGLRREGHLRKDTFIRGEWRDSLVYAALADEWTPRTRRGTTG
jgi:RimJ/RimL family protein N-acetyltransferase